jgi:hypothetical protein
VFAVGLSIGALPVLLACLQQAAVWAFAIGLGQALVDAPYDPAHDPGPPPAEERTITLADVYCIAAAVFALRGMPVLALPFLPMYVCGRLRRWRLRRRP